MPGFRLFLLILAFGVPLAGVVLLISHFTKTKVFPKYIPAILLFLLTVGFVAMAMWATGMEGLGYIILAMLAFGAGVISLLTAVGVEIYRAVKRRSPVTPMQPGGQGGPQQAQQPYDGAGQPQPPVGQQPAAGEPSPQQTPAPAQENPPEPGQNPPQEPPKQG